MTVYFGCDPSDSRRCRDIVTRCIDSLPDRLTPSRLEAAKKQYLGQLVIASENRENSVLEAARSLLWRNYVTDVSDIENIIKGLDASDLLSAAEPIKTPSVLIFSPE